MKSRFNNFEEVKNYLIEKKNNFLGSIKNAIKRYRSFKEYEKFAEEAKKLFGCLYFGLCVCFDLPEEVVAVKNNALEEYEKIVCKVKNIYKELEEKIEKELESYVL